MKQKAKLMRWQFTGSTYNHFTGLHLSCVVWSLCSSLHS